MIRTDAAQTMHTKNSRAARRAEAGLALPVVLATIAGLALITAVATGLIANSARQMTALDTDLRARIALAGAEAHATYFYLTSLPATGGRIAAGALPDAEAARFDSVVTLDLNAPLPPGYVSADGGVVSVATPAAPVRVTFRDGSGIIPFQLLEEEKAAVFLEGAGFGREEALTFAARIADYQDQDFVRRFRGAERSDYRIYNAPPPTDAPLRAPEELSSVYEFADAAPAGLWPILYDSVTFNATLPIFKATFAHPSIAQRATAFLAGAGGNDFDELSSQDRNTTDRVRFLLDVTLEGQDRRRRLQRAVEIALSEQAVDMPFRRYWIYDRTLPTGGETTETPKSDGSRSEGSQGEGVQREEAEGLIDEIPQLHPAPAVAPDE